MIVGRGGSGVFRVKDIDDVSLVNLLSILTPSTKLCLSVGGFDKISSTFLENALCVGEMGHERLYSLKLQLG
jgi:hypothetical protein